MTTITPDLRARIERRAKRAWRQRRVGASNHISRISDVTDSDLLYRLPYTPDYYGKEKVKVVRHRDGSIEVDPKTTGFIECKSKADLDKLKKHGGEFRAFMVVKGGTTYQLTTYQQKSDPLRSREQCLSEVNPGDRVYVVEADANDLTLGSDSIIAREFSVVGELDQVKDLGFTTGLLDCLTKADRDKLKKHIGSVRAYVLKKLEKRHLSLNKNHTLKTGERYASRQEVVAAARPGDRAYAAEFDYQDIEKLHSNGISASAKLVEELDGVKDLGFTTGSLLDLKNSADIEQLRKHIGPVRGYKYTTVYGESPTQSPKIKYEPGKDYEVKDANTDEGLDYGAGINIASQDWVRSFGHAADLRWFAFKFDSADIAAIPINQSGKLRCFRVTCVEEVDRKFVSLTPKALTPPVDVVEASADPAIAPEPKPKKRSLLDRLLGREGVDADEV